MFQNYKTKTLKKDILSGIIVALVSIPISMGYAQVAGLPVVYGLYGSLLPILVFSLITSSPQFVFGVDATPAALVGATLASLGIVTGSEEAIRLVPVITLVTAGWLLLFYIVRAGKLVSYISTPVMGGFISGIGCTIILMQVAKLFGGFAGTGELFVLIAHILNQLQYFNLLSAVLGIGTIVIILTAKKYVPKFPMSVVLMAVGAALTAVFHIDRYGVKLLPQVSAGLPKLAFPDVSVLGENTGDILLLSFTVALVIVAQTLLASSNYALKYNYKINNNREVLAYAAGNFAGALVGCCPINGSVSRTGIGDQFGARSQVMSLSAAFTMVLVLLFGTGLLQYLPVPVLTGIVICALIGILEFGLAKKLWKTNKQEFLIFMAAFFGVLIFGTIYGVIIGVILSFIAVIIRAVVPPKGFLGMIPGQEGFYALKRNRNAHPVQHTVIYRFSGNLFFANIDTFQNDIENAIKEDTKQVIVDASGIGSIDITAADRLVILNRNLRAKGIRFYLTEAWASLKTDEYLIKEDRSLKTLWNFIRGRDYLNSRWTAQLHQENRLHIIYLAVSPGARHTGVAEILMDEVIRYSESHRMLISLETHNEKNLSFYSHFGFKTFGIVEKDMGLKQYCLVREPQQAQTGDLPWADTRKG